MVYDYGVKQDNFEYVGNISNAYEEHRIHSCNGNDDYTENDNLCVSAISLWNKDTIF